MITLKRFLSDTFIEGRSIEMHEKSRTQQIYEYIKYLILIGELEKENLLHQNRLAIQFAMSWTPIHQALSGEGYVTFFGESGMLVSSKSPNFLYTKELI